MWIYAIFSAVLSCACCITLCVIFVRRYITRIFDAIDTVLDRALAKSAADLLEITGEDRLSKLTHKASRVVSVCLSDFALAGEEKNALQSFISDMSHQMKTPLSGIAMYADLLAAGDLSAEEQAEFLAHIKSGTEKLQWMMDSLIKMSRLEVGAVQLSPVYENVRQTISDAIASVIAAASRKSVNISVADFEDNPLYHDRRWTREVIVNILENAVKYSEQGGEIEIAVEPLPLYTKISITDHGIGLLKSEYPLIFKRFYRGQNVKDKDGAGLGLYLASLIMEKQGGYIMVDSAPGDFTSFSLFLQNCKK